MAFTGLAASLSNIAVGNYEISITKRTSVGTITYTGNSITAVTTISKSAIYRFGKIDSKSLKLKFEPDTVTQVTFNTDFVVSNKADFEQVIMQTLTLDEADDLEGNDWCAIFTTPDVLNAATGATWTGVGGSVVTAYFLDHVTLKVSVEDAQAMNKKSTISFAMSGKAANQQYVGQNLTITSLS